VSECDTQRIQVVYAFTASKNFTCIDEVHCPIVPASVLQAFATLCGRGGLITGIEMMSE